GKEVRSQRPDDVLKVELRLTRDIGEERTFEVGARRVDSPAFRCGGRRTLRFRLCCQPRTCIARKPCEQHQAGSASQRYQNEPQAANHLTTTRRIALPLTRYLKKVQPGKWARNSSTSSGGQRASTASYPLAVPGPK